MIGEVVVPPSRKLEDLIRLSELCVDLLRGNEEFYAEVSEAIMNLSYVSIVIILFGLCCRSNQPNVHLSVPFPNNITLTGNVAKGYLRILFRCCSSQV